MQLSQINRKMKEQSIQEENLHMLKRSQQNTPATNLTKYEDGYKNHLKLKKMVKKVVPGFNKLYKNKEIALPTVFKGQINVNVFMINLI